MASDGIDVGTSAPVVAAPVPVVEQPSPPVTERVPVKAFGDMGQSAADLRSVYRRT